MAVTIARLTGPGPRHRLAGPRVWLSFPIDCSRRRHMRRIAFAAIFIALAVIVAASPVRSQSGLGAGPKINISVVAHPIPTHPQYAKLDAPFFKETLGQRSGGRLEFKTSSWTEMSITGYEIVRMTRQGQIDIGGSPLTYIAQDVPFLDAADLAGLNPTVEQARKVLDALIPVVNKELERFNVKVIGSNPYPAQILFCRKPVKDFADLKGRKVRTFGPSETFSSWVRRSVGARSAASCCRT